MAVTTFYEWENEPINQIIINANVIETSFGDSKINTGAYKGMLL